MEYRLGDLYEVSNGLSKGGEFFGTGFPFLTYSTIFNNYFVPSEIKDLVQSTEKEQNSYSIKAGDVFITRTSETTEELGMSCVALKDYPNATYNGFCKRLRPITDFTYPLYMGYCLRTPHFRANFQKIASLITRASLRNEDLLRFKVDLPSIEEQKKIAEILYNYDRLIENNNKRIKLLEQMAENLYKEWFVRFRFPGYETAEFENGIPDCWKIKRLEEEVKIVYGKGLPTTELKDEGYPVFGSNGLIGYYDKYMYEKPQVTISCRGASSGVINITLPYSFVTSNSLICETNGNTETSFEYLSFCLKQAKLTQFQTGSAQPQITIDNIRKIKIIIPSQALVARFTEQVSVLNKELISLKMKIDNLIKQRDLLLPRLMSGKLEV